MKENYREYIGCYVKRFYTRFEKAEIYKIADFRESYVFPQGEFLYSEGHIKDWWADVEDSVIITNGVPIEHERVISVLDEKYKGYNPYTGEYIV